MSRTRLYVLRATFPTGLVSLANRYFLFLFLFFPGLFGLKHTKNLPQRIFASSGPFTPSSQRGSAIGG